MESLGNFLQNDTKFVQIPKVVMEILRFEIWRVPPFFAKTPILEEAYLQNYSSDFNKIEKLAFLYKLYKQSKFYANQKFLVKKFWEIRGGMTLIQNYT